MGKEEVNKRTPRTGLSEQETSDEIRVKMKEILKEFQVSFFSMSRLASFPWTVSMKTLHRGRVAPNSSQKRLFELLRSVEDNCSVTE